MNIRVNKFFAWHRCLALCLILFGCSPSSEDLLSLKDHESLLKIHIFAREFDLERGIASTAENDRELQRLFNQTKDLRFKIPINDELRESNIVDYLKSHMIDPFSFRLNFITDIKDSPPYADYGYSLVNVSYFGANAFGGTIRQEQVLRVSPHGFVVDTVLE